MLRRPLRHSSVLCLALVVWTNAKINIWLTIPAWPEWRVHPFVSLQFFSSFISFQQRLSSNFSYFHSSSDTESPLSALRIFFNKTFFFIFHQSLCEGWCLCPWLPRLCPMLGKCGRGVWRSAQQHEWLHDRQQRGRRCLVSYLTYQCTLVNIPRNTHTSQIHTCFFNLPEAFGVFLFIYLGTQSVCVWH